MTQRIDDTDLKLAANDPRNSLEMRSLRILDEEIARLERRLSGLQFVRATVERASHAQDEQ